MRKLGLREVHSPTQGHTASTERGGEPAQVCVTCCMEWLKVLALESRIWVRVLMRPLSDVGRVTSPPRLRLLI